MASYYLDDIRSLQTEVDEKARILFKEKLGHAPLRVIRVFRQGKGLHEGEKGRNCIQRDEDVWSPSELKSLRSVRFPIQHARIQSIKYPALDEHSNDSSQIFVIQQDRSWTTLNISRSIFQDFMNIYNVFPSFWKCVLTFGCKSKENEFQFPGFSQRRTRSLNTKSSRYELGYMLRRAERNGRGDAEDPSSWSIRQTAVYHNLRRESPTFCAKEGDNGLNLVTAETKSTFLLIAPSRNVEWRLEQCVDQSISFDTRSFSPWNAHRILVGDSMKGWMGYIAGLEQRLKEQSDRIVLATVGSDKINMSPLTDFQINFEDRQELKIIEDMVLDLQVILPGMLNSISGIQELCRQTHSELDTTVEELFELDTVIDEFEGYIRDCKMQIERSKALKNKAKSTAQLLSDLLSYDEATTLKQLQVETQLESKSLCHLTERSTKDAAAVKILTVITLVYLPTTIVANFFSTQFVQTNDVGHMRISTNVWLLAAISIPLTAFTILLWWIWVHFTKVQSTSCAEQSSTASLQRPSSLRSFASRKKRQRQIDLEVGLGSEQSPQVSQTPQSPQSPQSPLFHHPVGVTWSSTATTFKAE